MFLCFLVDKSVFSFSNERRVLGAKIDFVAVDFALLRISRRDHRGIGRESVVAKLRYQSNLQVVWVLNGKEFGSKWVWFESRSSAKMWSKWIRSWSDSNFEMSSVRSEFQFIGGFCEDLGLVTRFLQIKVGLTLRQVRFQGGFVSDLGSCSKKVLFRYVFGLQMREIFTQVRVWGGSRSEGSRFGKSLAPKCFFSKKVSRAGLSFE